MIRKTAWPKTVDWSGVLCKSRSWSDFWIMSGAWSLAADYDSLCWARQRSSSRGWRNN
jgi:hypothetical protein